MYRLTALNLRRKAFLKWEQARNFWRYQLIYMPKHSELFSGPVPFPFCTIAES